VISHVIDPVMDSACRIAWIRLTSGDLLGSGNDDTPRRYSASQAIAITAFHLAG
jgi:hypothetical protein